MGHGQGLGRDAFPDACGVRRPSIRTGLFYVTVRDPAMAWSRSRRENGQPAAVDQHPDGPATASAKSPALRPPGRRPGIRYAERSLASRRRRREHDHRRHLISKTEGTTSSRIVLNTAARSSGRRHGSRAGSGPRRTRWMAAVRCRACRQSPVRVQARRPAALPAATAAPAPLPLNPASELRHRGADCHRQDAYTATCAIGMKAGATSTQAPDLLRSPFLGSHRSIQCRSDRRHQEDGG